MALSKMNGSSVADQFFHLGAFVSFFDRGCLNSLLFVEKCDQKLHVCTFLVENKVLYFLYK